MNTVTTSLGTFPICRKSAIGLSVYRAGRSFCWQDEWIEPGSLFSVTHVCPKAMSKTPTMLYGGTFVARFRMDGTEVPTGPLPDPEYFI